MKHISLPTIKHIPLPIVDAFPPHIEKLLADHPYYLYDAPEYISSGSFGVVLKAKQKGQVIKLTKGQDAAYEAFISVALAYQNNPYFPRIYEAMKRTDGRIYVRMERLNKLPVRTRKGSKLADRYSFYSTVPTMGGKLWWNDGKVAMVPHSTAEIQARAVIKYLTGVCGFVDDTHSGNAMLRDNKQLVITDPICGLGELA